MILASLVECFLVLPGHLRHSYEVMKADKVGSFRNRFDSAFKNFRNNMFQTVAALGPVQQGRDAGICRLRPGDLVVSLNQWSRGC